MTVDNSLSDFGHIEIFKMGLEIWLSAKTGDELPSYKNLRLENLGRHIGFASVIEWRDRDTATYMMQGIDLISENHLDPSGLSLFNLIHPDRLEDVKTFDQSVVTEGKVGLATFSVHFRNGLSRLRKMAVFPAKADDTDRTILFICIEPM